MNRDSTHLPPGQCRTEEHLLHRRLFLKGLTGGALASVSSFAGLFHNPVFVLPPRAMRARLMSPFLSMK